ncbi:ABC transporter substrate-binding protein [Thermosyntropha sp.]|uniref:ABC transporter substrate-binding protein n=1 Tax=Thermosyntropha sp. TaxID=2740820 RepID=UPI00344DBA85|nr:ABC transporter substrate-binding protein [Thermosyntropha sp.]
MRVWLAVLLILFLSVAGWGCGFGNEKTEKLQKVRLCEVVHSVFYAPQYIAINEGIFAEEGLEIELTTGQGADKVMTALLSGSADIGLAGPEATIYVYIQGQEDYVLNFAQLTKRDGSFLLGRNTEPDFKWENLRGKTIIGGRPGGVPEMVLEYVLKQHGLKPHEEVNIITNLQFTATAGAFKGGVGDYVASFEPTASMLEKQGAGYVVASMGLASGELPYTVYMARKSYIQENPEVVQKFTNAIYKAQKWLENHSAKEIAESMHSFFPDTDIELLTTVIERYKAQDTWANEPIVDKEAFNRLQDVIIEAGEIKKPVDPTHLIVNSFAEQSTAAVK